MMTLHLIEKRMVELATRRTTLLKGKLLKEKKLLSVFKEREEPYKQSIINEIPEGEIIALYEHEEYVDMCRGPHVTNTKHLKCI